MACEAVHMWSLSGLVAAFLDLAVAYFLLCASSVVYLASKFLGFFGLNLPCPCDGMFTNTYNTKALCYNRLLIDFPTEKVSDVQLCVKQRYPFSYSESPKEYVYGVIGDNCVDGMVKVEGEASCSSDAGRLVEYDVKGKGVLSPRPRRGMRRRRGGGDRGNLYLCYDPPQVIDGEGDSKRGSGFVGDASLPVVDNGGTLDLEYDNISPKKKRGRRRAVANVEMNESHDEDVHIKKSMQSIEELQDNQQEFQSVGGDDKSTIRLLEQKLKEEHIARAALYIELEKERSAAAGAADEAMAMILRLQEEKASVQIEARQYQRILEDKSVYDAEEMSILKEILVRTEMEKLFLEKEVEAYMQMVSVLKAELAGDGSDKGGADVGPLPNPNVEKFSFDKNRDLDENSLKKPVCNLSEDVGLQEKEIIIANWDNQLNTKAPQVQETNQADNIDEKIIETCNANETSDSNHDRTLKEQEKDAFVKSSSSSCNPTLDKERQAYDLRIVGDDSSLNPVRLEIEDDVKRSSLEISRGLPPIGRTRRALSLVRGNSTSALDGEMQKIDSEIGRLRERLKLVQEGREKLGLNRERDNVPLTLLEEIALQVREIWRRTGSGKAVRQASLPPPTSKGLSKKRRSKSVSSGLHMSSD